MKESYVSYECAKRLKECGVDWECNSFYLNEDDGVITASERNWNKSVETSAPTLSLAQKWLREVKGWHIQIRINGVRSAYWYEIWSTTPNGPVYGTPDDDTFRRGQYETYELALSAGIDAALKILEGKEEKNNGCDN